MMARHIVTCGFRSCLAALIDKNICLVDKYNTLHCPFLNSYQLMGIVFPQSLQREITVRIESKDPLSL